MRDLHERFDSLFDDEPEHRPLAVHLASGHRALRRRRVTTGVGALAALAIVAGTGYAVQGSGGDNEGDTDRVVDPVASQTAEPATRQERIVDSCHDTDGNAEGADYLWRGGAPDVMASIVTWTGSTRAYLRSGNGRFWGECWIEEDSTNGELASAYRIAPDPQISNLGYGYGIGQACRPQSDVDADCPKFVATHEGRRDPAVARIEVRFMDGKWEKVDTNEGYYFIEHVGALPPDITWSKDGMPLRNGDNIDDVINRIKLFDADGNLIAYWDASQNANGPNLPNDKGVADLEDYPMIQSKMAGAAGARDFP